MKKQTRAVIHITALYLLTAILMCVYTPLLDAGKGGVALWEYAAYALYLSIAIYINVPLLFQTLSKPSSYTIMQAAMSLSAFIGIALFIYPFEWEHRFTDWRYYCHISIHTTAIGFIPFVSYTCYIHRKHLKKRISILFLKHTAKDFKTGKPQENNTKKEDEKAQTLTLTDENGKMFSCALTQFIYAEAQKNYTAVYFLKEGKAEREILRVPLKNIENESKHKIHILRCHRSFVINLKHMIKYSGNSNGYQVALRGCAATIPVSRAYADTFVQVASQMETD